MSEAFEAALRIAYAQLLQRKTDLNPKAKVCQHFCATGLCVRLPTCRFRHPSAARPPPLRMLASLRPLLEVWLCLVLALDVLEQATLLLTTGLGDPELLEYLGEYFLPLAERQCVVFQRAGKEKRARLEGPCAALTRSCNEWRARRNSAPTRAVCVSASGAEADLQAFARSQTVEYDGFVHTRDAICEQLQTSAQAVWSAASVLPFGSSANGFGSSASDVDLVLHVEAIGGLGVMDRGEETLVRLRALLCEEEEHFAFNSLVLSTRVPVLRLTHVASAVLVDVCVNNVLALRNTSLLLRYSQTEALRSLVHLVKHWARARQLNCPAHSTLTSYAWVLLVVFFLQQTRVVDNLQGAQPDVGVALRALPSLEAASRPPPLPRDAPLSTLLLRFFEYYSSSAADGFAFSEHAASIRLGCRVPLNCAGMRVPSEGKGEGKEDKGEGEEDKEEKEGREGEEGKEGGKEDTGEVKDGKGEVKVGKGEVKVGKGSKGEGLKKGAGEKKPSGSGDDVLSSVALSAEGYRFVIEDPFEEHDLGRVVRDPRGHAYIMQELRRGASILRADGSGCWAELVAPCEAPDLPYACRACGEDHSFKNCPLKEARCFLCHGLGHERAACPRKPAQKSLDPALSTRPAPPKRAPPKESQAPLTGRARPAPKQAPAAAKAATTSAKQSSAPPSISSLDVQKLVAEAKAAESKASRRSQQQPKVDTSVSIGSSVIELSELENNILSLQIAPDAEPDAARKLAKAAKSKERRARKRAATSVSAGAAPVPLSSLEGEA